MKNPLAKLKQIPFDKVLNSRLVKVFKHHWLAESLIAAVALAAAAGVLWYFMQGLQRRREKEAEIAASREVQFTEALRLHASKGTHGELNAAVHDLLSLPARDESQEHRYLWNRTMAGMYHGAAAGQLSPERERNYDNARQFYQRALLDVSEPVARAELKTALVEVSFAADQPAKTLALCEELLAQHPPPVSAPRLLEMKIECLRLLPDATATWGRLSDLVKQPLLPEQRTRALLAQTEVLAKAVKKPGGAAALVAANPELARPGKDAPAALYVVARGILETALLRLAPGDERRARVLGQLLDICIAERDADGAYRYFHNMETTINPAEERIPGQRQIARLEVLCGNLEGARETLQRSLDQFPNTRKSADTYFDLVEVLRQQRQWALMLSTLRRLAERIVDPEVTTRLLDTLVEITAPPWPEPLPNQADFHELWVTCQDLVASLTWPEEARYDLQRHRVPWVLMQMKMRSKDFAGAEKQIAQTSRQELLSKDLEQASYSDLVCARELQRSPPVMAFRAARYLAGFPAGPHSEEAQVTLLSAYNDMGLFAQAVDVAQASFVTEMLRSANANAATLSPQGLDTMVKLARAYTHLGQPAKANLLFRTGLQPQLLGGLPVATFEDWAAAAAATGQEAESQRRLKLGCQRIRDPREAAQLELAQDVRSLQRMDTDNPIYEAGKRDRWREEIPTSPRLKPQQTAYEDALFPAMAASQPEAFRDELRRWAQVRPRSTEWREYWLLKGLSLQVGQKPPGDARRWVTDLQDAIVPRAAVNPKAVREASDLGVKVVALPDGALQEFTALNAQLKTLSRLEACEKRRDRLKEKGL